MPEGRHNNQTDGVGSRCDEGTAALANGAQAQASATSQVALSAKPGLASEEALQPEAVRRSARQTSGISSYHRWRESPEVAPNAG